MGMKILVAYDGSKSSDNAIRDLNVAGFPTREVDVLAMSVAEVWMPPPPNGNGFNAEDFPDFVNEWAERRLKVAKSAVNEAETLSRHAKEKISERFPGWTVSAFSTYGSPAWEVLIKADEFKPDVIVVGSQGRNAVSRILLGSVSRKILTEAECTVRISRRYRRDAALPNRVMIGFDGSTGSDLAVEAVAARNWESGTEIQLVAAVQSLVPTTIGRFIPPIRDWVKDDFRSEKHLIEKLAEQAFRRLEGVGVETTLHIEDGNPKQVLVDLAEKWNATSIFMGAHSYHSEMAKLLVGCTSTAVVERAQCSVEAVRGPAKP